MNITLTSELEQLITTQLKTGQYQTARTFESPQKKLF
jgi:hypothetical protein